MELIRDCLIILGLAAVAMFAAILISDSPRAGAFGAGAVGVAGAIWFAFRGFHDDLNRSNKPER